MTLYLASGNRGKLREFREGAQSLGIGVEILPGIQDLAPCVEDGRSFVANSRKKAIYYSEAASGLVFADDSGLCVDALGGAPGIFSARYAGDVRTDEENNQKLLDELNRLGILGTNGAGEISNVAAHYVCVIALAEQGSVIGAFEGRVDGVIQEYRKGDGGFGYDPLFYVPDLTRTFAEISADEKFAISHRGRAFREMVRYLHETHRLP